MKKRRKIKNFFPRPSGELKALAGRAAADSPVPSPRRLEKSFGNGYGSRRRSSIDFSCCFRERKNVFDLFMFVLTDFCMILRHTKRRDKKEERKKKKEERRRKRSHRWKAYLQNEDFSNIVLFFQLKCGHFAVQII